MSLLRKTLTCAIAAAIAAAAPHHADAEKKSVLNVHMLASGEAELLIYGFIGDSYYDESSMAQSVVTQLASIVATTIQVRINSPGGSVADGLAIYNALRRHGARIVTSNDGQACSIASLIFQAGDERVMAENTLQMIHAPSAWVGGNSVELRAIADVLDSWATAMKSSYVAKAPEKAAELQTMLTDGQDHYFTAEESVAFGIADTVLKAEPETVDENAAAAALLGYIDSISKAPLPVTSCLRRHIAIAATPQVFASLPEANQRAVFAHIEDQKMRKQMLNIMAAAAGAQPVTDSEGGAAAAPAATAAAATAATVPAAPSAALSADAVATMVERNDRIRAVFANFGEVHGVRELEVACLADPRISVEAAQQRLLDRVGGRAVPARPSGGESSGTVTAGADESDRLREAGVNMLMARAAVLPTAEAEAARQGNPFLNCSLIQMAERSLIRSGVNTREMDREQIARQVLMAQTTSDFPVLLENTLHKMLQIGYRMIPFTWMRWCATGTLADYRPHPRYSMSSFSDLKAVNEAGEYKQGTLGDGAKESIQGSRKGRILNVTPEVLINDDLGAISRPTIALGQAAGRTIEKDAIAKLVSNPTMGDGTALFHADHNNLLASGGGVPTAASWDAARQAIGSQLDPGGNDYLDISPALWLGPLALGTTARLVNTSEFNPDSTSKYAPPNTSRGMVRDVIDTPRLTGTAWYMLADPAIEPVIEVAFLNGVQTPTILQESNFRTDGLAWKVVHRYGVGAVGWRGAFKNPGA